MNSRIRMFFISLISVSFMLVNLVTTSYADDDSDFIDYIDAVEYMLGENLARFSQENIDKLNDWIYKSKKLLEERKNKQNLENISIDERISNEVLENISSRNKDFQVGVKDYIGEDRIYNIFQNSIKEDKYFYYALYKSANISTNYYDEQNELGENYVDSVDFTLAYRQSISDENEVETFINDWIEKNISEDMSDIDKVKLIHDFIVRKNNYNTSDQELDSNGYSIYTPMSILFGDGGVCNAYSTLFDKMGEKAGLETYYVTGKILDNEQLHIWNMVKIKDDWYNIDLTWDDPILTSDGEILNADEYVSYDYFLVSDDEIKKTRTIDEDKEKPLAVNNYKHNFAPIELEFAENNIKKVKFKRI